jgi:hypothetical protein
VPLYEGLAAGCTSIEADIWIRNRTDGNLDLFIGNKSKSLSKARTLQSLYLDPLHEILTQQNAVVQNSSPLESTSQVPIASPTGPAGVFSMAPETTLVLLLDFKMSEDLIWETVKSQLSDFRNADWLSYWTPDTGFVLRPLTIVASGEASFDLITANSTYREIFFDSPIKDLSGVDDKYNANNSYYASTSLGSAVGKTILDLSGGQKDKIRIQVQRAEDAGLKSRYWDTPSWPVGWRNRMWNTLIELGADILNVDDLTAGAIWDWQLCIVAGVNICTS